jgi:uncharacterized protein
VEDYTVRVARTWKLGRKDVNDGVLLFVARDDRKLRIEVGYGLEGVLTDADSALIISRLMVPRFREGDFAGGIEAAVVSIDGAIRGEEGAIPAAGADSSSSHTGETGFNIVVAVIVTSILTPFMYFALVLKGFNGWFVLGFLAIFVYAFAQGFSEGIGIAAAGIWVVAASILRLLVPKRWRLESGGGEGGSGGRSGSGFSSSGSSGGGFSGGGGSFGGGGASGSW